MKRHMHGILACETCGVVRDDCGCFDAGKYLEMSECFTCKEARNLKTQNMTVEINKKLRELGLGIEEHENCDCMSCRPWTY